MAKEKESVNSYKETALIYLSLLKLYFYYAKRVAIPVTTFCIGEGLGTGCHGLQWFGVLWLDIQLTALVAILPTMTVFTDLVLTRSGFYWLNLFTRRGQKPM